MHHAGSDRATGVTEERPSRREAEGFVGVAPGITRGTSLGVAVVGARDPVQPSGGFTDAAALRPRCDSARDSIRWIESRAGVAQQGRAEYRTRR